MRIVTKQPIFILLCQVLLFSLRSLWEHRLRWGISGMVSGVDLLVGAPTGPLNLVFYTFFNLGQVTQLVSLQDVQRVSKHASFMDIQR